MASIIISTNRSGDEQTVGGSQPLQHLPDRKEKSGEETVFPMSATIEVINRLTMSEMLTPRSLTQPISTRES